MTTTKKPEGIEFVTEGDKRGYVVVTVGIADYELRRPTFGRFLYYVRRATEFDGRRNQAVQKIAELQAAHKKLADRAAKSPDKDYTAEFEALGEQAKTLTADTFYEDSSALLIEMFAEFGDPLPDIDTWPLWLGTDISLPVAIVNHWRTNPKASGPTTPI